MLSHAQVAEELTHTCWQMYHQMPTGDCHCALYLCHSGDDIGWAILCNLLCTSERLWPQWASSDALCLYCRLRPYNGVHWQFLSSDPVEFWGWEGTVTRRSPCLLGTLMVLRPCSLRNSVLRCVPQGWRQSMWSSGMGRGW